MCAAPEWPTPAGWSSQRALLGDVQARVVEWWQNSRREDLPWRTAADVARGTYEPYPIWVSEVMAQQTQMSTVIVYFRAWMSRFPTIEALAAATEAEVRSVWSGMGYYRRASFLLKGAQFLVAQHAGRDGPVRMPSTAKELLRVPGIGAYTAAAIASVCYGERVIAVDGNVVRVLARLRGERSLDPKKPSSIRAAQQWGQQLMIDGDCHNPAALNQGLMELGAGICRPNGAPHCDRCPLSNHCRALQLVRSGDIAAIEGVIPQRAAAAKRQERLIVCVVYRANDGGRRGRGEGAAAPRYLVTRRGKSGLLSGMLDFASLPLESDDTDVERVRSTLALGSSDCVDRGTIAHILSNTNMQVRVFLRPVSGARLIRSLCTEVPAMLRRQSADIDGDARWLSLEEIQQSECTRLCLKILEKCSDTDEPPSTSVPAATPKPPPKKRQRRE